ncbi:MAG: terminase large subunit domain-containing protein [Candidatus Thorarchaeota archaeon]
MPKIEVTLPYKANKGQRPFHKARLKYEWRGLIGGTASGKTLGGAAELIHYCMKYPKTKVAVFAPTFPMLKRNIISVLESLLGAPIENSPLIKSFHKGDMLITWITGSQTWLNSLEYPERAEGQSLDAVWIDEFRLVRDIELSLQVIQRRLRGSGSGAPICAWITTTPDEPNSTLHKFFEDPETRHPKSKVFRVSLLDNKENLPEGYVENIIRTHPGAWGDRFVKGLFVNLGEGSFKFDPTVHVLDKIEQSIRRMFYGIDWGWTNPACILAVGLDYDGRAYVLDEFYKRQATDDELMGTLREFITSYGKGKVLCGHEEPKTIEKFNKEGLKIEAWAGKREDGIRDIGSRLIEAGDGRHRLYIHSNCVNLISEMQTYDAGKQVNDHAIDALRYALSGALAPKRTKWHAVVWD